MAALDIYFDGGNYKNRICVWDELQGTNIIKSFNHREYTNNELEYKALLEAIKYTNKKYPTSRIRYIGDSKLVIGQVWKGWKINHEHLLLLNDRVFDIIKEHAKSKWVRRDFNLAGIHLENLKRKGE